MNYLTADQWILVATILAIIASPIIALTVTNKVSDWKERRSRRYDILRSLMSTRRARLDGEHVRALNLVELEFYKKDKIRAAYKSYVKHLYLPAPQDRATDEAQNDERNDLFAELLTEIATDLGYSFDKSDLARLGYQPRAFAENFDHQMANAELIRSVLEGRRAIPITNFVQNDGVFPPPPKPKQIEDKGEE